MVCIIYNLILTNMSHFIFTCLTFIIIVIKYFSAQTDPDNGTNEISKNVDEEPEINRIRPLAGTSLWMKNLKSTELDHLLELHRNLNQARIWGIN